LADLQLSNSAKNLNSEAPLFILKHIAAGNEVSGDTTTLEDFAVLTRLSQSEE
jgi:hypothetical protein